MRAHAHTHACTHTHTHTQGLIAVRHGWVPARHLLRKRTIQYGAPHDVFVAFPSETMVTVRRRQRQRGVKRDTTMVSWVISLTGSGRMNPMLCWNTFHTT